MLSHVGWVLCYIIGFQVEGVRASQAASGGVYLGMAISYFLSWRAYAPFNLFMSALAALAWAQNVYFAWKLGACDYSSLRLEGPYEVGVRYIRTHELGTEASVFYPVDGGDNFKRELESSPGANAPIARDVAKALKEKQNTAGQLTGQAPAAGFVRAFTRIKMGVLLNGKIAERFRKGEEAVRPVVFSHGLSSINTDYTGMARDLASHGYLVVMPNHQDGSCAYTETKDGTPMLYKKEATYGSDRRRQQLGIRVKEILALVQELTEMPPEFHKQMFGATTPDVKVDMTELILSGHSFGGVTAVTAAAELPENA